LVYGLIEYTHPVKGERLILYLTTYHISLIDSYCSGSSLLYRKFVHPALVRREQRIDAMIEEAQTRGYQAAVQLGGRGIRLVTNSLNFNPINIPVVYYGT
jgi:hypothetical protein